MKQLVYRIILLEILFFCAIWTNAQSANQLRGLWKGQLKDSVASFDYELRIEKVIGNKFFGSSVSSNQSFYCETKIMGTIKGAKITVYEAEIAKTNYKNKAGICLLALNVMFENGGIKGRFRPITNTANCLAGSVQLSFIESISNNEKKDTALIMSRDVQGNNTINMTEGLIKRSELRNDSKDETKKTTSVQPGSMLLSAFNSRTMSLIKEINIDAAEAEITLFDNGVVDGDLITLIDNQVPIFEKASLSTKPLSYKINNREKFIHSIAFFAENLGSIPPNTGLMVITANGKRWEINFSSDYSNTSFVKIILASKK